jgi:hypothetical protein
MSDYLLDAIRELIQVDVNQRGLRTDPEHNLVTATFGDLRSAAESLANGRDLAVAIVTGFLIPSVSPPQPETDGPLGAVFLARALSALGAEVALACEPACKPALVAGLSLFELRKRVPVHSLDAEAVGRMENSDCFNDARFLRRRLTHLIAVERVGPSHRDRYYTMTGVDVTDLHSPAHLLFENAANLPGITTIGIGDGGNEIGMGKLLWELIDRNIPGGGRIACRVPTDFLIVSGVSNWGAYGLAARATAVLPGVPRPLGRREDNL